MSLQSLTVMSKLLCFVHWTLVLYINADLVQELIKSISIPVTN